MSAKRYLADTNILLRFFPGEPVEQAAAVKKLFRQAAAGEIVLDVPPLIVAETFDTLVSFYGVERKIAAGKLSVLLQPRGVKLRDSAQVLSNLERLLTANVGFADAFLAACAQADNVAVVSFDRDFEKLHLSRREPVPQARKKTLHSCDVPFMVASDQYG